MNYENYKIKLAIAQQRKAKRLIKAIKIGTAKPKAPSDVELDALCRHYTVVLRDKGICCRCGSNKRVQASHVLPKGKYKGLRWELDNVKALCWHCHFNWWHKNPIESSEWFKNKYPQRWQRLAMLRNQTIKVDRNITKLYLQQEIKILTEKIKGMI